jgi:hypothetical protein
VSGVEKVNLACQILNPKNRTPHNAL